MRERNGRLETDAELIAAYPNRPYKLLLRWNDTRQDLARAGETYVAEGRQRGSSEDRRLKECEEAEATIHMMLFGI